MASRNRWAALPFAAALTILASHATAADWDGYDWETDSSIRMEAQPDIRAGDNIELYDAGTSSTHRAIVDTVIHFDESLLILELLDQTEQRPRTVEIYR